MERGGGVGVDAEVRLDDDVALASSYGGVGRGLGQRVRDGGEAGGQGAGVGREGCGEAGGIETGWGTGVLVDDAEVAQIVEHLRLGWRERFLAVVLAEFEAGEGEEKGKDVYWIHA